MIGDGPRSTITGLPGWETYAEQVTLMEYAIKIGIGSVIVEIGVEFGMSTGAFALATTDINEIYSVDLFPDRAEYGDMQAVHANNLAEAGFAGRFTPLKGDSKEVGKTFKKPIDLCFVDGDHSYEGAKADLEVWTPHVTAGGYVLIHDCACATNHNPHPLHFEVQRAVEEWKTDDWTELPSVDSMRVFQRKSTASPAEKKPTVGKGKKNEAVANRK